MFFHGVSDQEKPASKPQDGGASKGDGLHHHEIHQLPDEEGGGYHSKHTHPDGSEEHGDHADYAEAKADMDAKFDQGHGGDAEEESDFSDMEEESESDGSDGEPENIAEHYGRKARK